jgi:hypothetical protein
MASVSGWTGFSVQIFPLLRMMSIPGCFMQMPHDRQRWKKWSRSKDFERGTRSVDHSCEYCGDSLASKYHFCPSALHMFA